MIMQGATHSIASVSAPDRQILHAKIRDTADPEDPHDEQLQADDDYDDMEQWFSDSFPSELSTISDASFKSRVGGGNTASDPRTSQAALSRRDGDHLDCAVAERDGSDHDIDDFSIEVDDVDDDRNTGIQMPEAQLSTEEAVESEFEGISGAPSKTFKRRRRNRFPDEVEDTSSLACCGRCKSDLNGKLIVGCASCSFRRHLYCFTPPLKQHPAFQYHQTTSHGKKVVIPPPSEVIAKWTCDDCRDKIGANQKQDGGWIYRPSNVPARNTGSADRATSTKMKDRTANESSNGRRSKLDRQSPTKSNPGNVMESTKRGKTDDADDENGENSIHSVQKRWRHNNSKDGFDWHAFRAQKLEKVFLRKARAAVENQGELVYYSQPFSDMKKTTACWLERVESRKRFERQRDLMVAKQQLAPKWSVMHTLTERELAKIENTLMRRQREAEEEALLFDDSCTYPFDISLDKIRYLRQRRPAIEIFPYGEASDVATLLLAEIAESIALSSEDFNASPGVDAAAEARTTETAKPNWAAKVIQSAVVHWSYQAKRKAKAKLQQARADKDRKRRQARATASISVVRLCVRFLILLMRKLRDVQVKRELLLTFQEASDDTKVANSAVDALEKAKTLAEKRIQRFFLRRVRPYLKLKQKVMSRRIVRWWRRKFFCWKWRAAAVRIREMHRERACRSIQRMYRRFRVKKAFQELLEKHALKKMKRLLRSWLMARVVKKEKCRAEIYTLALSLHVADDSLTPRPEASVEQILYTLGMGFYGSGDFWNAASMLERARKLRQAAVDRDGCLALAYSHHMTWYLSYDAINLTQAYEMYSIALNEFSSQRSSNDALSEIDPFILQDVAIVMMQMENFNGSLRMLARLIEFFPQYEGFPLWLLLASVQLQQKGEWSQSVAYLTYLQDIPPSPYLERDILCLCAIGLEHESGAENRKAGREAWKAAIREWSIEQKEIHALDTQHSANPWVHTSVASANQTAQTILRKREMLHEFSQRAVSQGHYLLACRLMLCMLELHPEGNGETDGERRQRASVWWSLADVFRHLGHIDLYIDASTRSHLCVEVGDPDVDIKRGRIAEWRSHAEAQAQSFHHEIESVSTLEKLRQLNKK